MKKVAIYCRVSSQAQEQEQTIQSQVADLREIWKDHQIVKEYLDDGWSGELLDRPALDKLRNDAKLGLFDIVSIHSIDRLSRKLYHQGIIVEELKKEGIEVFVKNKPISDSPEGKFLFNILGAVAEFEKEKILERTRRGRIYKVRIKKFLGYNPPYGYNYIKKTTEKDGYFTINKKEAKIVRLIFDLYIKYQSMTRVQKELALREIKPRRAKNWCRSTIGQILKNESYTGTGYYNKRQSIVVDNGKRYQKKVKTGIKMRPKSEWLEVKFPPILSKEKFKLAGKIRGKKFKPFGKSKYFYLLSGLIRCALCGSTFTGSYNGNPKKYTYYRCTNRRKRFPNPQYCHAKHMRADRIEPAVWSAIVKAITHPEILTTHILNLVNRIEGNEEDLQQRRRELMREKKNITSKKEKLDALYFRGLKTIEDYEKKMREFNKEEKRINDEIERIENTKGQKINKSLIIEKLQEFSKLAKQNLRKFNLEQKQKFLRYLIEKILLNSNTGKARIIGYIPIQKRDFEHFFSQTDFQNQVQMRPLSIFSNL